MIRELLISHDDSDNSLKWDSENLSAPESMWMTLMVELHEYCEHILPGASLNYEWLKTLGLAAEDLEPDELILDLELAKLTAFFMYFGDQGEHNQQGVAAMIDSQALEVKITSDDLLTSIRSEFTCHPYKAIAMLELAKLNILTKLIKRQSVSLEAEVGLLKLDRLPRRLVGKNGFRHD